MGIESLSNNNGENMEKKLDPRVESLAIPLARDYAEKNYSKMEDGTFQPAWRGVNGEKSLKNKSPEDLIAEGYSELAAHKSVIDIANESMLITQTIGRIKIVGEQSILSA